MSATFDIIFRPFGSRSSIGTIPLMRLPNSLWICCTYSCWEDILFFKKTGTSGWSFNSLGYTWFTTTPLTVTLNSRNISSAFRVSVGHHVEHVIVELACGHQLNHGIESS